MWTTCDQVHERNKHINPIVGYVLLLQGRLFFELDPILRRPISSMAEDLLALSVQLSPLSVLCWPL